MGHWFGVDLVGEEGTAAKGVPLRRIILVRKDMGMGSAFLEPNGLSEPVLGLGVHNEVYMYNEIKSLVLHAWHEMDIRHRETSRKYAESALAVSS